METLLPPEFHALSDKVAFVTRKNDNEYHSSCPQCGGAIHDDGSFPDRFVMWRSSKFTGRPFAMCLRGHCGFKWSPDKQDANWTDEERAEFMTKRAELELEYERKLTEKLSALSRQIEEQGYYRLYHEQGMKNNAVVEYFERVRRIPREWQVYLQKGYIADYTVKNRLTQYKRIAYTNPVWTIGGRVENIKLRIDNPLDSNDRFRNYYKSGCQHLYTTEYEKPLQKRALLLEGENKCDAVSICGFLPDEISVLGVQSKQPEKRILDMLKPCELVYIAFDPDAYKPTVYYDQKTGEEKKQIPSVISVAKTIGMERVRFLIPPRDTKFDDALFRGYNINNAINMAVRVIA